MRTCRPLDDLSLALGLTASVARARSALMCDTPNASRKAMIATTNGRFANQGGSGVMNGVIATGSF